MSIFDKSLEAVEAAKKKAVDALGEENIEKLKKSGRDALDVGSDVLNRASKKVKGDNDKTGAPNKQGSSNARAGHENFVAAICPQCGASLEVENGIDSFYCQYCGAKVVLSNQSDEVVKAKAAKQKLEHRERMADKVSSHLNERAARRAAEKEKQRKNTFKITGVFIAVMLVLIAILMFMSKASDKKKAEEEAALQVIVAQIEEDMKNGDYDSALVKANNLYFTSSTGPTKRKWDDTRKAFIAQIEEAKSTEKLEQQSTNQTTVAGVNAVDGMDTNGVSNDVVLSVDSSNAADYELGDIVLFGNYPLDFDGTVRAIEWEVTSVDLEKNSIMLMSKGVLNYVSYNEEAVPVTWENCSLRSWLNSVFFINAFDDVEKNRIVEHPVVVAGNTVNDLVSIPEIQFPRDRVMTSEDVEVFRAQGSCYSYSQGAHLFRKEKLDLTLHSNRKKSNSFVLGTSHPLSNPEKMKGLTKLYCDYWAIINGGEYGENVAQYIDGWGFPDSITPERYIVRGGVRPVICLSLAD